MTTWQQLRLKTIERDGKKCQICDSIENKLQAHHLIPFNLGGHNTLGNLITVCEYCHVGVELAVFKGTVRERLLAMGRDADWFTMRLEELGVWEIRRRVKCYDHKRKGDGKKE